MDTENIRIEVACQGETRRDIPEYVDDLTIFVGEMVLARVERYQEYYSIYWDCSKKPSELLAFTQSLGMPLDASAYMGLAPENTGKDINYSELLKESVENPEFDDRCVFIRIDSLGYDIWCDFERRYTKEEDGIPHLTGGIITRMPRIDIIQGLYKATTNKDFPVEAAKKLNRFLRRYEAKKTN